MKPTYAPWCGPTGEFPETVRQLQEGVTSIVVRNGLQMMLQATHFKKTSFYYKQLKNLENVCFTSNILPIMNITLQMLLIIRDCYIIPSWLWDRGWNYTVEGWEGARAGGPSSNVAQSVNFCIPGKFIRSCFNCDDKSESLKHSDVLEECDLFSSSIWLNVISSGL